MQRGFFTAFAKLTSRIVGEPIVFTLALTTIIVWAITGPFFHFSDTWQLIINTSTTIITFLMVFLIQNTQNRDSEAMHLKLDELIRATHHAHNSLLDIEELNQDQLDKLKKRFELLAAVARTGHIKVDPHEDPFEEDPFDGEDIKDLEALEETHDD